jgi:hypothetical protein
MVGVAGEALRAEAGMIAEHAGSDLLEPVKVGGTEPVVTEVLRFENLGLGSLASRRAVVRSSDGGQDDRGASLVCRRRADLRRRSWELSAYVLSR